MWTKNLLRLRNLVAQILLFLLAQYEAKFRNRTLTWVSTSDLIAFQIFAEGGGGVQKGKSQGRHIVVRRGGGKKILGYISQKKFKILLRKITEKGGNSEVKIE